MFRKVWGLYCAIGKGTGREGFMLVVGVLDQVVSKRGRVLGRLGMCGSCRAFILVWSHQRRCHQPEE